MPLREIIAKSVGFGLTAATSVIGGILLLIYPHAYNDYVQFWLALFLIVLGVGIGGVGGLLVFGIIADARLQEREEQIHVTPRPGPYAPPPPWGMADVGRPDRGGVVRVGEPEARPRGGGGPRVMSVAVNNIDAPLLIGALVVWTIVFLIWLAPR
ncbi:MAG: hypothetical protein E6J14_01410 [Chloroflexi bacterium]|nr:MAG: hypothetical protein E6J14_01410 [Chloroflexota bacterium]